MKSRGAVRANAQAKPALDAIDAEIRSEVVTYVGKMTKRILIWASVGAGCIAVAVGIFAYFSTYRLRSLAETTGGYFQNKDIQLRYALDIPKQGERPFPVVVLGHGSGKTTAYGNIRFAEKLVEHGIAVLRYDKRGVGRSGGVYSKSVDNLYLLASDMVAAVEFVKRHEAIDSTRIGLMGSSQAGFVIPIAASECADVRFAILLSGPTVTVAQHNYYDQQADDPALGTVDLSRLLDDFKSPEGDFDPKKFIKEMNIPVLWLFGAEDRIIPATEAIMHLDAFVEEHGKQFSYVVYPDAGHGLRNVDSQERVDYWVDLLRWFDENVR